MSYDWRLDCEGISLLPKNNNQWEISSKFVSIVKSHYPGFNARRRDFQVIRPVVDC
jgi:hypothetical protein